MAEELAADGIRIALGASDRLAPVQIQAISIVVVAAQALDEPHRLPPLLAVHAVQGACLLYTSIAKELGLTLWDVRFEKEGASYFLRILIDKEGGVDINSCEAMSRRIDPLLDEADPIPQSYYLEVWSAGMDRALERDFHFEQTLGQKVTVGLFQPLKGEKDVYKRQLYPCIETLFLSIQNRDRLLQLRILSLIHI